MGQDFFQLGAYEYLKIEHNIDSTIRQSVLNIVYENWESFCEQGTSRLIFDFKLCIDIGDYKPLYYRQSIYGIHKKQITNKDIQILEGNDWIYDCVGP